MQVIMEMGKLAPPATPTNIAAAAVATAQIAAKFAMQPGQPASAEPVATGMSVVRTFMIHLQMVFGIFNGRLPNGTGQRKSFPMDMPVPQTTMTIRRVHSRRHSTW